MKKFWLVLLAIVFGLMIITASMPDIDRDRKEFKSCVVEEKRVIRSVNGGSQDGYREAMVETSCGRFGVSDNAKEEKTNGGWAAYSRIKTGRTYDLRAAKGSQYSDYDWLIIDAETTADE